MTKLLLVFFCTALLTHAADSATATITEETKLEFIKGKGSILLKKGSTVSVISKEGDALEVIYHNVQGRVPLAKTDFKGDVPKNAAPKPEPKSTIVVNTPAPTTPPAAKPADPKTAAPANPNRDNPQSTYGKMVKKARDNEAKHKDNLVDPTDETVGGKK